VAAFGGLSFAAAAAPTILVEAAVLFPIGAASLAFVATANSTVQLASDPEKRGRVMSLFGLVLLGSSLPSGLLSGWLAGQFGPRSILLLSGVSCVLAAAVAAFTARSRVERSPALPGDAERAA
jgi:MFS family permease